MNRRTVSMLFWGVVIWGCIAYTTYYICRSIFWAERVL